MQRGIFAKLKKVLVPGEHNEYRPYSLRRKALVLFIASVLVVEGAMVGFIVANTSVQEFLAAIFPGAIIAFTNDARAEGSLGALRENELLTRAAQRKANDMAAKGYFSHVGPDGKEPWDWLKEEGYPYAYAGENLAVNFFDSSDVVRAWMDSPSHKANIVKPAYEEIGIGVAQGTYQGKVTTFVVQFFGTQAASSPALSEPPPALLAPVPASLPAPRAAGAPSSFAPAAPSVEGEETAEETLGDTNMPAPSPASLIVRVAGSPRLAALWLLSAFASLLVVAMALTFFIKIHIQPLDLLGRGAVALAFVLGVIALNASVIPSGIRLSEEAASVIEAFSTTTEERR